MTEKTFFAAPITRSRWADPTGYEVFFNNCQYREPTAVAKFLPQQWGDIENCKTKATELCALLNGEIEVVPYDINKPWSPRAEFFRAKA